VNAFASMIVSMRAYMCRHNGAYVTRWLVGMKILRAQDKTKRVQLERDDSANAYAYASMLMRHSGKLFGTKGRHKLCVLMATIRLGLETAMFFQHRQQGNHNAEARQ
jgi:hypothetical protein